jgi:hypothetical protein
MLTMRLANKNQLKNTQPQTLSLLAELTDDEAEIVNGGRKKEEKPETIPLPKNNDVPGQMQDAWWIE